MGQGSLVWRLLEVLVVGDVSLGLDLCELLALLGLSVLLLLLLLGLADGGEGVERVLGRQTAAVRTRLFLLAALGREILVSHFFLRLVD